MKVSLDNTFRHALSPFKIGYITLRNRIFVSAHVPGFAEDNKVGESYIAYHRARAAGGAALQLTGCQAVHRSGLLSLSNDGLRCLDDSVIPGYQRLANAIHDEGGRMLAQIGHSAGTVYLNQAGYESWSPSAIRSETTGAVSHAMSVPEIKEIVEAFGQGARRAAEGNLDGVEILGAFGYLPQAFLSPLTNQRNDEYGGSFDNRIRFFLEVIDVVRAALGSKLILGVRIPGDEFAPGGLDLEDMKAVSQRIEATGQVDYLNIIAHSNFGHIGRSLHWPPTPAAHGIFVPLASAIRQVVNLPVFTIGRITDPAHADRIIAEGHADMVGMTRAHLTDPDIVTKMKRGDAHRIRPCVGANVCIAARYNGKPVRCMHNPQLKMPEVNIKASTSARDVIVVGGGPAGLEAARVAALRGHRVTLHEATNTLGGQVNLWSKAPSMRELHAMIDWRETELQELGVRILLNSRPGADELSTLASAEIVIATGATPLVQPIPGDNSIRVINVYDFIAGEINVNGNVLVWSDGRGQAGLVAAELLGNTNAAVEIITSDIAVAADLDATNQTSWYQRLGAAGITLTPRVVIDEIKSGSAILRDVYTGTLETRDHIELIVDWRGLRSYDTLYDTLKSSGLSVHRVGDCIAPRTLEIATADAFDVANEL